MLQHMQEQSDAYVGHYYIGIAAGIQLYLLLGRRKIFSVPCISSYHGKEQDKSVKTRQTLSRGTAISTIYSYTPTHTTDYQLTADSRSLGPLSSLGWTCIPNISTFTDPNKSKAGVFDSHSRQQMLTPIRSEISWSLWPKHYHHITKAVLNF